MCCRSEDAKENGGGFSFFPITPPSAEPQPVADSKLFKSWPSVRSSCTSELIAASDDDNAAADYADDGELVCMICLHGGQHGRVLMTSPLWRLVICIALLTKMLGLPVCAEYSKSVSKPASRSPSQNLSDVLHKAISATTSDDADGAADLSAVTGGWSFQARRQQKSDPSSSKSKVEREPSLDLVPPQSKSSPMSSISEPCKGMDVSSSKGQSRAHSTPSSSSQLLTSPGSGALSAGGAAESKPSSDPGAAPSAAPTQAEEASATTPAAGSPAVGDSKPANISLSKEKEASLGGVGLGLPLPEAMDVQSPDASTPATPASQGAESKSESKGMVADVVAHMIQLSLESLPMSPGSQHGGEEHGDDQERDQEQQLSSQASQAGAGEYAGDADDDDSGDDEDGETVFLHGHCA